MHAYPFTKHKPLREEVMWQTEAQYKPTDINYFLNMSALSLLCLPDRADLKIQPK